MNNNKVPDKWLMTLLIGFGFIVAIQIGWNLGKTPEERAEEARARQVPTTQVSQPMTACDKAIACVNECNKYALRKGKDCVYEGVNSKPSSMVESECKGLFQTTLLYCAQTCVEKYGKC